MGERGGGGVVPLQSISDLIFRGSRGESYQWHQHTHLPAAPVATCTVQCVPELRKTGISLQKFSVIINYFLDKICMKCSVSIYFYTCNLFHA